jgi:diguanylate cyclase (GGDEF)-like protein
LPDRPFQILAIDDADDVRQLLGLCLRADGYQYLEASNGADGLRLASEHRPDLILLDLVMPDLDGLEVLRRLKRAPATRRIPVIFLSARGEIVDRVQGLSLGASDYLAKPFDFRELLARVEVALRTKEAIDSLEQANSALRMTVATDTLTGLHNRRHFDTRLKEELSDQRRSGVPAACLLLDGDHFKAINDAYGHLAGDAVLRRFGQLLRDRTRKEDVVARFGGDEFAILLIGADRRAARATAEKIRALVEAAPFEVGGRTLRVTTSIGVACFELGSATSGRTVLEDADRALYQAKAVRNRVEQAASC